MQSFRRTLFEAAGKSDNDRVKEKHILGKKYLALQKIYPELEFPLIVELIVKQLENKSTPTKLRTLYVVHRLMNQNSPNIIDWFHTTNIAFEINMKCHLNRLVSPYYDYLKARCRFASAISFFMNPRDLASSNENSDIIFEKTEKTLIVMEAFINTIKPCRDLMDQTNISLYLVDIFIKILSDSEMIYNALKIAIFTLWQIFDNFKYFDATGAKKIFLKYNLYVKSLKEFSEICHSIYPGEKPTYSVLNEGNMLEVDRKIKSLEDLVTSPNTLGDQFIEENKSPVIPKRANSLDLKNLVVSTPKHRHAPSMDFRTTPRTQVVIGYPVYVICKPMMSRQPMFYPPFPKK